MLCITNVLLWILVIQVYATVVYNTKGGKYSMIMNEAKEAIETTSHGHAGILLLLLLLIIIIILPLNYYATTTI